MLQMPSSTPSRSVDTSRRMSATSPAHNRSNAWRGVSRRERAPCQPRVVRLRQSMGDDGELHGQTVRDGPVLMGEQAANGSRQGCEQRYDELVNARLRSCGGVKPSGATITRL